MGAHALNAMKRSFFAGKDIIYLRSRRDGKLEGVTAIMFDGYLLRSNCKLRSRPYLLLWCGGK